MYSEMEGSKARVWTREEKKVTGEGEAYTWGKKINCTVLLHVGVSKPIGKQTAVMQPGSVTELSKT